MQCGTSHLQTVHENIVTYHFSDLQEVYSGNRQIHKMSVAIFTPTPDINKWQMSL